MPNDFMFGAMASDLLSSPRRPRRSLPRREYIVGEVMPTAVEVQSEIYDILETMMDAMEVMSARIKELEE